MSFIYEHPVFVAVAEIECKFSILDTECNGRLLVCLAGFGQLWLTVQNDTLTPAWHSLYFTWAVISSELKVMQVIANLRNKM